MTTATALTISTKRPTSGAPASVPVVSARTTPVHRTATVSLHGRSHPEPGPPRLTRMARAFAVLFCEAEAGARPRRHVQRLMTPLLVARLTDVWLKPTVRVPQVLRVHGRRSAPGIYDAVALLDRGSRITALSFRIRRTSHGWRVDDLVRPEDGPLPEPAYPVPQDEPDVFDLVAV